MLPAFGQKTVPTAGTKKVLIGFSFSPDYSHRRLHNNDGNAAADLVIAARNRVETGRIGFTAGLNLLLPLSQTVALETGLSLANKGYRTRNNGLITNFPDPAAPEKLRLAHAFRYLDIPVKILFQQGNNNLRFFVGAGAAANIFLSEKIKQTATYAGGNTVRTSSTNTNGIRSFGVSPMVSMGLAAQAGRTTVIRVEPIFRYSLSAISETPVTAYLWNAGINFTLFKSFR